VSSEEGVSKRRERKTVPNVAEISSKMGSK